MTWCEKREERDGEAGEKDHCSLKNMVVLRIRDALPESRKGASGRVRVVRWTFADHRASRPSNIDVQHSIETH